MMTTVILCCVFNLFFCLRHVGHMHFAACYC